MLTTTERAAAASDPQEFARLIIEVVEPALIRRWLHSEKVQTILRGHERSSGCLRQCLELALPAEDASGPPRP